MRRLVVLLTLTMPLAVHAQNKKPPTDLRGVLLEQLRTTHSEEDWFVPAKIAVDGLTAEQAKWSPGKGNHSVGQLAYHLWFWDAGTGGIQRRKIRCFQREQRGNVR
jgi:hypothetical protein